MLSKDKTYALFFNNLKKSIKTSPPGFKKVRKYKSVTLTQYGWKLQSDNSLIIMKGRYKYSKSQKISGNIKTQTIKRDTECALLLFFVTDEDVKSEHVRTGKIVGMDFGFKTF
jgi:putative transposase